MTNYLKIDRENKKLIQDKAFAKNADIVGTKEYYLREEAIKNYPYFTLVTKKIKKNHDKVTFDKLSYDFMRKYIERFVVNKEDALIEFEDILFMADGTKNKYPNVKHWFLAKYPEVKDFFTVPKKEPTSPEFTLSENFEVPQEEGA